MVRFFFVFLLILAVDVATVAGISVPVVELVEKGGVADGGHDEQGANNLRRKSEPTAKPSEPNQTPWTEGDVWQLLSEQESDTSSLVEKQSYDVIGDSLSRFEFPQNEGLAQNYVYVNENNFHQMDFLRTQRDLEEATPHFVNEITGRIGALWDSDGDQWGTLQHRQINTAMDDANDRVMHSDFENDGARGDDYSSKEKAFHHYARERLQHLRNDPHDEHNGFTRRRTSTMFNALRRDYADMCGGETCDLDKTPHVPAETPGEGHTSGKDPDHADNVPDHAKDDPDHAAHRRKGHKKNLR